MLHVESEDLEVGDCFRYSGYPSLWLVVEKSEDRIEARGVTGTKTTLAKSYLVLQESQLEFLIQELEQEAAYMKVRRELRGRK
jgi:hypothetical protein